jgi:hypothetical protein
MASEADVKDLIDRGMAPVQADLNRFESALRSMSATSDLAPPAAIQALRAAQSDANAAYKALDSANQGHIRLAQGGSQALQAFLYLGQGLGFLVQALTSTDAPTVTRLMAKAKGLIDRSNDELLAADRALGCPYGCRPAPAMPKIGGKP